MAASGRCLAVRRGYRQSRMQAAMPTVERGRRSRKAAVPALGPVEGGGYRAMGGRMQFKQLQACFQWRVDGTSAGQLVGQLQRSERAHRLSFVHTTTSNTQGFPGTSAHWLNSDRDLHEPPTRCRLQAARSDPLPPLGHLGKPASRQTSPTGHEISSFSSN